LPDDWRLGGFGLYVHWPFCEAKCPYCDFNSHVSRGIDQDDWQRAYLSAISAYGEETADRVLNSVYFGGGTPSLMEPGVVAAILEKVSQTWTLANDIEITLEANPSSVEAARFKGYRNAGINRVSLGVQALNDADLRRLGRLHDVKTALSALEIARTTFDRVSFDLIYARQDQTFPQWRAELAQALALEPRHLSLYQLTVEPGTAFGDRFNRGKLRGLPDEDLAADLFELTQEMTTAAGLPAYEVSNHAGLNEESRHNLIYWHGGDYVGIGPGAHGRITKVGRRFATETALQPSDWLSQASSGANGEMRRVELTREDHAAEYLMMSLRTRTGLDCVRFQEILGSGLSINIINDLVNDGLLRRKRHRLIATQRGITVLNAVVSALLPD